jgi:hypothetical protein
MRALLALVTLLVFQLLLIPSLEIASDLIATAQADELIDTGLEPDDTGLPEPAEPELEGEPANGCPFLEAHPFMACPYLAAVHMGHPQVVQAEEASSARGTCPYSGAR